MPETSAQNSPHPGDAELARAALAHAVARANGDGSPRPEGRVRCADTRALGPGGVRAHFDRILLARHADLGLDALLATGVLGAVMPEVQALVGLNDYEWRHKDVWRHTKQVVAQSIPRLPIRWAALLHDIGKPKTRRMEGTTVSFIGHPDVGARLFDRLEKREKLFATDPDLRAAIRFLVLYHQRASQYESDWTDSAVRRFARELGAHLPELLLLARADMTTKNRAKKRRMMYSIKELQDRITALAKEDAKVPPLPTGVGDAIMEAFGIPPSRLIGDMKRWLEELVEDGELPSQGPFEVYVEHLRRHRGRFGI
jgi:poly(A) polymerase